MPRWVKLLIQFLLELLGSVKEPETKSLLSHSIEAVKGTPTPNAEKAAKFFRAAAATEKIPKKVQAAVEGLLKQGGAPEEEETERVPKKVQAPEEEGTEVPDEDTQAP